MIIHTHWAHLNFKTVDSTSTKKKKKNNWTLLHMDSIKSMDGFG